MSLGKETKAALAEMEGAQHIVEKLAGLSSIIRLDIVLALFPEISIETDNYGQLLLYTGYTYDASDRLVSLEDKLLPPEPLAEGGE